MTRSRTLAAYCLFALSGLSCLIYESLWVRVLSLGVGSTSAALSIVLSIFFTGLAIGSVVAGRWAPRLKNPLRAYAFLEGLIGILGFLIIFPLVRFQDLLGYLPAFISAHALVFIVAKFFLVFVLLAVPTFAMGATFPLLTSHLVLARREEAGGFGRDSSLELLYGINTLGAVVGAFSTSFFLLPAFGVVNSNAIAAALNIGIAGLGLYFSRQSFSTSAEVSAREDQGSVPLSAESRIVLALGGVLGFCSITAEIVWNKYLGIFFGTNIYGLGLILSLYLTGIGLGSLLGALLSRRFPDRQKLFVWLMVLALAATFAASRLLNVAPVVANTLAHYLAPSVSLLAIKCLLAAMILFLPTLLFGAAFPLMIRVAAVDETRLPRVASWGYAINTMGAVGASCFAGIYLVPHWGSAFTLRLCFVLMGAGILVYLFRGARFDTAFRRRVSMTTFSILVVCLTFSAVDFRNIIKSAYVQSLDEKTSLAQVVKVFAQDSEEFKLIVEGETAVTSLSHDPSDGAEYRKYLRLKSNGLNESVYRLDDLTSLPKFEALLGFLPYAFVRAPHSAFVVGYGGGYTADFLTRSSLKQVDVVELEPGILKAADVVYDGDNPILERKNLNLRIEDARFVLATARDRKYDIIVSQPSHSWLSGVANLFTLDFFEIVRGRLAEGGVFSQWLNLYNIDARTLRSILRTFYSVFPYGSVFTDHGDAQMIMIGSMSPLVLNLQKLQLLSENEILRKQLKYVPFDHPHDLFTNFSMGRSQIDLIAENADINTDDNAFAEVRQSRLFYERGDTELDAEDFLRDNFTGDYSDILEPADLKDPQFYYRLLKSLQKHRKSAKFFRVGQKFEDITQAKPSAELAEVYFLSERYASAASMLRKLPSTRTRPELNELLLRSLSELGRFDEILWVKTAGARPASAECFEKHARLRTAKQWARTKEALLTWNDAERLAKICGAFSEKLIGEIAWGRGDFASAAPWLAKYLESAPGDAGVLRLAVATYDRLPDGKESAAYYRSLLAIEQKRVEQLAEYYGKLGHREDAQALNARLAPPGAH